MEQQAWTQDRAQPCHRPATTLIPGWPGELGEPGEPGEQPEPQLPPQAAKTIKKCCVFLILCPGTGVLLRDLCVLKSIRTFRDPV